MSKPIIVWAFPITPASAKLLAYCDSLEQALYEAGQHRRDLSESGSLDEPWPETPILKLTLKPLDRNLLLSLLNEREPDWSTMITRRETVAIVTEQGLRRFGETDQ